MICPLDKPFDSYIFQQYCSISANKSTKTPQDQFGYGYLGEGALSMEPGRDDACRICDGLLVRVRRESLERLFCAAAFLCRN